MNKGYRSLLLVFGAAMALSLLACGRSEEGKSVKGERVSPKRVVLPEDGALSISRQIDADTLTGILVKTIWETFRLGQDAVVKVVAAIRKGEAEGARGNGRFPVDGGGILTVAEDAIVTLEFKSGRVRVLEAVATLPPFLMWDRVSNSTLKVTLEKKVILRK